MATNKIAIVVVSGTLERLQMAAMVASVAAVSGQKAMIFLSMNALPYFMKSNKDAPPHEGKMGDIMATKNVPDFKMLFEQAVELGDATIYPCSMAMDILKVNKEDLDDYLVDATGLTKFLDDARDGQVWTF